MRGGKQLKKRTQAGSPKKQAAKKSKSVAKKSEAVSKRKQTPKQVQQKTKQIKKTKAIKKPKIAKSKPQKQTKAKKITQKAAKITHKNVASKVSSQMITSQKKKSLIKQSLSGNKSQSIRLLSHQPSTEQGFTGSPTNWFDDNEFFQSLCADLKDHKHDYYFNSYSNFYIHEEMLKDKVRTEAYKKAIDLNRHYFQGKTVMDIGCGTGVLSIFAARAGAKKVYAVENAEIAYFAQEIIKQNGLSKVITVLKGKVEEVKIPEKVDIIISEWMGYFLLYESMLDSVLWARDKYLKPNGKMFPNRGQLFVAAIEDAKFKESKVGFWKNIYGIDMSCMAPTVLREPLIDILDSKSITSSNHKLIDLDFDHMDKKEVEFSTTYKVTFQRNDKFHGLVSWFDTLFSNMTHEVNLSTSPYGKPTHWKQVTFYTDHNLKVQKNDTLEGSIAVKQSKTNFRELDVKISFHFNLKKPQGQTTDFVQLYKVR